MSRNAEVAASAGTMVLAAQGCGRAELMFPASCPTLFLPSVQTMDDDAAYNPFSSSHIWRLSASSDDLGTYESSLFAPLELDSRYIASIARKRVAG